MADIKRATSMEIAYQKTVEKIINERLQPGTPLREEHLAAEFNLSPTPVREAFRRLENEGWLQSFPYRGSFLRVYSAEDIEVLFTMRELAEGAAVKTAAQHGTAEDFSLLDDMLEREWKYIESCEAGGKYLPTYSEDLEFHRALVKASHSEHLCQRYSTIQRLVDFFCLYNTNFRADINRLKDVYTEHFMVVQAIRRGWDDAAETLIRRHISNAGRKLAESLKKAQH